MKILVLYHYYHPDDVVSATHYTDLSESLAKRNFEVEVWPANRPCHPLSLNQKESGVPASYSTRPEMIKGVKVHRVWRPPFRQHSFLGRMLNAYWMMKYWWLRLAFRPGYRPDVILIGTDPLLSVTMVPFLKFLRPKAKMIHWCFDLYPEAAVADGLLSEKSTVTKWIKSWMNWGYQKCDLIADLGACMGERLKNYKVKETVTLTPWALEEPPQPLVYDKNERELLFGQTPLGLLYSGNLGRAHEFYLTLKLARLLKDSAVFTYSVRGSRLAELKHAIHSEDSNIHFAEFAPPAKLSARLCAPDAHLVSLRSEWAGVVVPSKFFGALAVGRPVLYEGPKTSEVAQWIEEYKVGWVLTPDHLQETANEIMAFSQDEKRKLDMFKHCHAIYTRHFSKQAVVDGFDREIRKLLNQV
jgi:glycosyltransferase involved in cell wall biosynthesis